ncbi:hypothetical protein P152DRAFT_453752 [Eremomyces bilateralis CBS 781.70]|uniref:Uncharacterized protein n=1 Tax=Eremomyces bilateralis CBS 781.70 TaxID=1392243 RepID=A0A6G1GGC4_9PEZI|nr:uncharacterized protein P152DRAFT_453752 [Eremomyces bilateralis CBS 781.70]KAF1817155.1 hypothetical protein P152DRAFT_453752 [Eremomyces bilateralis CBS 781.70]
MSRKVLKFEATEGSGDPVTRTYGQIQSSRIILLLEVVFIAWHEFQEGCDGGVGCASGKS